MVSQKALRPANVILNDSEESLGCNRLRDPSLCSDRRRAQGDKLGTFYEYVFLLCSELRTPNAERH